MLARSVFEFSNRRVAESAKGVASRSSPQVHCPFRLSSRGGGRAVVAATTRRLSSRIRRTIVSSRTDRASTPPRRSAQYPLLARRQLAAERSDCCGNVALGERVRWEGCDLEQATWGRAGRAHDA